MECEGLAAGLILVALVRAGVRAAAEAAARIEVESDIEEMKEWGQDGRVALHYGCSVP